MDKIVWVVSFMLLVLFVVVVVDCSAPTNLEDYNFDFKQSCDVPNSLVEVSAIIPKGDTPFEGYGSITLINNFTWLESKGFQDESGQYRRGLLK
ncbi:hypothetical protein ACIQZG_17680 [Lysinibacillus sp. NPDC096418]|uniref:hypothetical protein n=1 Tax=Lysinibacillus sp. NPDC096418 TaxID=3364138 RepID=UPI0038255C86